MGVVALTEVSDFLLNIMEIKKIAKAMAECFISGQETHYDGFSFIPKEVGKRGGMIEISIYKEAEPFMAKTCEYIPPIHNRAKIEANCEEKLGWIILKEFAAKSELEGTDLYEYLSSKCAEEGISLDVLDKHSEDILAVCEQYQPKEQIA